MKRRSFLTSLIGVMTTPTALKASKPEPTPMGALEPDCAWCDGHSSQCETCRQGFDDLWPNERPFPCLHLDCAAPEYNGNCMDCRRDYNFTVMSTGPDEYYEGYYVDEFTGMWGFKGLYQIP